MNCEWCGRWAPPDPETGYDGDGVCSDACADALEGDPMWYYVGTIEMERPLSCRINAATAYATREKAEKAAQDILTNNPSEILEAWVFQRECTFTRHVVRHED